MLSLVRAARYYGHMKDPTAYIYVAIRSYMFVSVRLGGKYIHICCLDGHMPREKEKKLST